MTVSFRVDGENLSKMREETQKRYTGRVKELDGEISGLQKRKDWLERRAGLLHTAGAHYEDRRPNHEDDPVCQYVNNLSDRLSDALKSYAKDEGIHPVRAAREIADGAQGFICKTVYLKSRSLGQEEYNAILSGKHDQVKIIERALGRLGSSVPQRPNVKPVEGDQLDVAVANPVESRPTILFPDAEEYRAEMEKLRTQYRFQELTSE